MPINFNVERVPATIDEATFVAVPTAAVIPEFYFKKSDGTRLSRQNERAFDLVMVKIEGQRFVTFGTCNHVPTINEMVALSDPAVAARSRALEKVEEARIALAAAEADLRLVCSLRESA